VLCYKSSLRYLRERPPAQLTLLPWAFVYYRYRSGSVSHRFSLEGDYEYAQRRHQWRTATPDPDPEMMRREEPNHVSVDCRHRQLTLGFCMATGPVFRRTTCCCDTEMALFYLFTPRAPRLRAIHVHVPRQCKCVFPSDGQTSLPNRMRLSREQGKNYSQEAS
jgi:hypothetical protein